MSNAATPNRPERPTTGPTELSARTPSRRPGPSGGKRDTNRKERTDAIHKAALALFLERGIENVTVDDIAKAAGTAKGNFYRYASDKKDLVEALLGPLEQGFDNAFTKCSDALDRAGTAAQLTLAYMSLATELFAIVTAHPDAVRLWLQESRAPGYGARQPIAAFDERLTRHAIELTTVAHRHGLLKKIPPDVSALAVVGAVERLLIAHLRDHSFANPNDAIRHLVRLVMEGLTG